MIDVSDPDYSVSEQCRLLNLARSSYYHAGVGESEEDLVLKRALDRLYTDIPFFGSRKMVVELAKLGFRVCRKRVRRFYNERRPHQSLGYKSPMEIHRMNGSSVARKAGA